MTGPARPVRPTESSFSVPDGRAARLPLGHLGVGGDQNPSRGIVPRVALRDPRVRQSGSPKSGKKRTETERCWLRRPIEEHTRPSRETRAEARREEKDTADADREPILTGGSQHFERALPS
jgi:uncharacterized membrane protein